MGGVPAPVLVLYRGLGYRYLRVPAHRMTFTCGGAPLPACTTDDVVRGLAQVSGQIQNTSTYLFVFTVIVVVLLSVAVTFLVTADR